MINQMLHAMMAQYEKEGVTVNAIREQSLGNSH
jgi:hypothetical protein